MRPNPEGTGAERIAAERQRQLDTKRWSARHDDEHENHDLARAACAYAAPEPLYRLAHAQQGLYRFDDVWPDDWAIQYDKRPRDAETHELLDADSMTPERRIRQLEKAGALIAAEIDRLLRLQTKATK
jgi:hypothetical protein